MRSEPQQLLRDLNSDIPEHGCQPGCQPGCQHGWEVRVELDRSGEYHMAADESIARERAMSGDRMNNVLRLYSWSPPAVSIGYQQKLESIDLDACARHGVDVVRRPTGGRAVLHWNELTYAVIMRASPDEGIYRSHNKIVEALIASLSSLSEDGNASGLEVTAQSIDRDFKSTYTEGKLTNIACFASSARHEATFGGRKVIGSAQRRFSAADGSAVLLQHGSILLTDDHLKLPLFVNMSEERRASMRSLLSDETATLSDVFRRPLKPEEVANSVQSSFVSHICSEALLMRSE